MNTVPLGQAPSAAGGTRPLVPPLRYPESVISTRSEVILEMEDKLRDTDISKYKKYRTEQFKASEKARLLRYRKAAKAAHKAANFINRCYLIP